MSRMLIVVGDALQTGGSVLSGSPHTDIEGRAVARVGDRVICARHGPGSIVSGDASLVIDGQPVARDGDKASCGCALVAGQQQRAHVVAGGGGGGSSVGGKSMTALGAVASVAKVLMKKPELRTPGFAPPGTEAPQCWVRDHEVLVDRDIDGRYYQTTELDGTRVPLISRVTFRIWVPLKSEGDALVFIRARAVAQPGVSSAQLEAAKRQMQEGIDTHWNGKLRLSVNDPLCGIRTFPIRYAVEWDAPSHDYTVRVHTRFDREQLDYPVVDVSIATDLLTFAHEFGHCVGLPDEYSYAPETWNVQYVRPDGSLDANKIVALPAEDDPGEDETIMSSSEVIRPFHAWSVALEVRELLTREIGREITCDII